MAGGFGVIPRWFWLPALIGMLLVPGCKRSKVEVEPDSTAPALATPRLNVAAPQPKVDTAYSADSVLTKGVDTTAIEFRYWTSKRKRDQRVITTVTTKIDSVVKRVLPQIINGMPFGVWGTPPDSVCQTGYSAALFGVRFASTLSSTLDKAKACGVRLILSLPGNFQRDAKGLSVKNSLDSLAKWPWVRICADSTVMGVLIGDDLTHAQWGSYPTEQRLVMWDSIWVYPRSKCAKVPRMARFRPSQVDDFPTPKNLTTLWAQYTGPKRHGKPQDFFGKEAAVARVLKVGLVEGLNVLNGGCGPTSFCLPGIPGTSATGGSGLYQMSAAEVKAYGSTILADPYACGLFSWGYGYESDFFKKPENRAALDSLQAKARARITASCTSA